MEYRILKIVGNQLTPYHVQGKGWLFWGTFEIFCTETSARDWLKLRIRGLDREVVYKTGDDL